jgi:hypothetical protein
MRTNSAWVPSMLLPRIQPPVVQCEYMPLRQNSQRPQALMQEIRTRSPGLKVVTPAPTVDHAHAFVAEHGAGLAGGHVALEDVQVGAADGGLGDAHDGIGGVP